MWKWINEEKWKKKKKKKTRGKNNNKQQNTEIMGAFLSTKNSGNSGLGSEWNRHFPEFHSEILGVPCEVGLHVKFRKIRITGKFRSIRPFLLGPSFSKPRNRNSTWLILKLLNIILVLCQSNDWNILLQRYCSGSTSQALASSAKIQSYMKCEHNHSSEPLPRHSKVTVERVRKIGRYRRCSRGLC